MKVHLISPRVNMVRSYSIVALAAAVLCCCQCQKKEEPWENHPIQLPTHVGYGLNYRTSTITVLDLDKNEVVGVQRFGSDEAWGPDFAIGPDNKLYIPIQMMGEAPANLIKVLDPASGKVDSIEVSWCPADIFLIPDNRAVIGHSIRLEGESKIYCTILDLYSRAVVKTLKFDGLVSAAFVPSEQEIYILTTPSVGGQPWMLYRLEPNILDTLGSPLKSYEQIHPYLMSINDQEICYPYPLNNTIRIMKFRTGEIVRSILVQPYPYQLAWDNERLFVLHTNDLMNYDTTYNRLSIVDPIEGKVESVLDQICASPIDVAYYSKLDRLYVASIYSSRITVIDAKTKKVIDTILPSHGLREDAAFLRLKVPQ